LAKIAKDAHPDHVIVDYDMLRHVRETTMSRLTDRAKKMKERRALEIWHRERRVAVIE